MEKDLINFNKNIEFLNKEYVEYKDEKGNVGIFPILSMICSCSYLELDKIEYDKMKFEMQITDEDYNIINVKRPSSKFARTKKEEDRFIIEEKEVAVRQVWLVKNNAGAFKCFTNKKEAIETTTLINAGIMEKMK